MERESFLGEAIFISFKKLFDCKVNMSANQSVKNAIKKAKAKRETLTEKRIEGTQKLEENIRTTRPQLVTYLTSKPAEQMNRQSYCVTRIHLMKWSWQLLN